MRVTGEQLAQNTGENIVFVLFPCVESIFEGVCLCRATVSLCVLKHTRPPADISKCI